MPAKDINDEYPFNISTVGDSILILQHKDDPSQTKIAFNPNHELFPVFLAIMEAIKSTDLWARMIELWEGPSERPFVRRKTRNGNDDDDDKWPLMDWDDRTDRIIKTLADAIVELRFSNPDRTQITVQHEIVWPEAEDA